MGIYDFTCKTISGEEKNLSDYKGKVLLIVNTASKCGFTPQYGELEALYEEYKDRGLEILGFPSNQFLDQDPGSNEEIHGFCRLNYGVKFQMFAKGDVRGETAQPLFRYLTEHTKFKGFAPDHPIGQRVMEVLHTKLPDYLPGDSIKWNFTKFLIDREGAIVGRYEPTTSPEEMKPDIEKLLS